MIILAETYATNHNVFGRTCSNIECRNILGYEGTEHGVTPLGFYKGRYLSITTTFLLKIAEGIKYSYSTYTEFWDTAKRNYKRKKMENLLPSKPAFVSSYQKCLQTYILPFIPNTAMTCITCGDSPEVIVIDGTSIGIKRDLCPKNYFNVYEKQLPPPTCANPSIIRHNLPNGRSTFFKSAVLWSDLSVITGNVEQQELFLWFALNKVYVKGVSGYQQFNQGHMSKLLLSLRSPGASPAALALLPLVEHYEHDLICPSLLGNVM